MRKHNVPPRMAAYWTEKAADPAFHAGELGGARHFLLTNDEQRAAETTLWAEVAANPTQTMTDLARKLSGSGYPVNRRWVERVFKNWRWSYKNARYKSPLKYTLPNLRYYAQYMLGIVRYPLHCLKFLDESRFDAKALQRKRGVSRIGQPVIRAHGQSDPHVSYSITLLTSLEAPNGIVVSEPRDRSNNRWDFFGTIMELIEGNFLRSGDILVMDNAPIHVADEMLRVLEPILDLANVRLVFLPKYSPELNPCEKVFAQVKRYLRDYRGSAPFRIEVAKGFSEVTRDNIVRYYEHCLYEFDRD